MIIECLVTKNLSTTEQSKMGTARTGTCVCSHVTEVGVTMGWQYVMKISVMGSRNRLPFAKEHQNSSEIIPTRCNSCVYSSQWLYSTCFG